MKRSLVLGREYGLPAILSLVRSTTDALGRRVLQNVITISYATVNGQNYVVRSYDPDNRDIVISLPADLDGGPPARKLLHSGEYEHGESFPWLTEPGPTSYPPTQ
jgi:hypothetical protein